MGIKIRHGKGQFWGKGVPVVKYRDFLPWAVPKTAELIDLPFGLWTRVGRRKHKFKGHIGATWRIRLNCPSAAAMRLMWSYFGHLLSCDVQRSGFRVNWGWSDNWSAASSCRGRLRTTFLKHRYSRTTSTSTDSSRRLSEATTAPRRYLRKSTWRTYAIRHSFTYDTCSRFTAVQHTAVVYAKNDFLATVCKTVRPMQSVRCLSCLVCPSCLSVTMVAKRLDGSRWNLARR